MIEASESTNDLEVETRIVRVTLQVTERFYGILMDSGAEGIGVRWFAQVLLRVAGQDPFGHPRSHPATRAMERFRNRHQPVDINRLVTCLAETVAAVFDSLKRLFDKAGLFAGPGHASLGESLIHQGIHSGQTSYCLLIELDGPVPFGPIKTSRQSGEFMLQDVLQLFQLKCSDVGMRCWLHVLRAESVNSRRIFETVADDRHTQLAGHPWATLARTVHATNRRHNGTTSVKLIGSLTYFHAILGMCSVVLSRRGGADCGSDLPAGRSRRILDRRY